MSHKTQDTLLLHLLSAVLAGIAIMLAVLAFIGVKNWWTNTLFPVRDWYCQSVKKVVKADPIFEDNGKYEDESYRVTYDDGSVGIVDDAYMYSGYYCVSESFEKRDVAEREGMVRKP